MLFSNKGIKLVTLSWQTSKKIKVLCVNRVTIVFTGSQHALQDVRVGREGADDSV